MAKRDPAADALTRLAALKQVDDPEALAAGLTPLLSDKTTYVVARAAELAGERSARATLPLIIQTFEKLLKSTTIKDVGCQAKTSLARAIVKLEAGYEAEDILLVGLRHEHWESIWGGSADLAVGLRGQCAIGLAAMGSRSALRAAVELLAEPDLQSPRERVSWTARSDAARALTMIGSDGAAAVLRFKVLLGDPEPAVIGDCLAGVIAIEKQEGLDLAEKFLGAAGSLRPDPNQEAISEATLLAIGGSRNPGAFPLLQRNARRFLDTSSRQAFLASVAMTRQEAAIDYLLDLVATASRTISEAAEEALEPIRLLPRLADRLNEAKKKRT